MPVSIEVRTTGRALRALRKAINRSNIPVRRALNKRIRETRKAASGVIREELALKKRYVDERLTITKATLSKLEAKVSTPSRGVLLSRFPNRQLKRKGRTVAKRNAGISVKVKRGGGFKKLRRAFFIKLRRGNVAGAGATGIAIREENGIKVLHAPSVSQALNTLRGPIVDDQTEKLRQDISDEMNKFYKTL